jgi:hypothetical protein
VPDEIHSSNVVVTTRHVRGPPEEAVGEPATAVAVPVVGSRENVLSEFAPELHT